MHIGTFLGLQPSMICPHECVDSAGPECDVCTSGAAGRGFRFPAMPRILNGRG